MMSNKLQQYALVAEITGGIAIVASLIFVGLQIVDGNREVKAATTQAVLEAEMYFQSQLVSEAEVWENVVINGDLSDRVATRKAIILFNLMHTQNDMMFQMQKAGYVGYYNMDSGTFAAPGFLEVWRQSPGAKARSPEYMQFVDEQLATGQF